MNKNTTFSYVLLSTLLFALTSPALFGEDTTIPGADKEAFIESARAKNTKKISIADCIEMALEKNLTIKVKRIDPQLSEDNVKIAKSAFEPVFGIDYLLNDNTEPSITPFISGDTTDKTRATVLNGNVKGRLYPGTIYEIDFLTNILKTDSQYQDINPAYTAEPKITISQPILRNFGITVNTAPILIAKNVKNMTQEDFRNTVMEIVTLAKIAYYNYIYAIKYYIITKSSIKRTHELVIINRARYKKGLISSVDLLETETAFAQRVKALITAESSLKTAEDNLKIITNMVENPSAWNAKLELTDMPAYNVVRLDLVKSLQNAFVYRPDYLAQKIDLKNKDISIKVTKNALLPTLDLIGSFGLNGLGDSYSDAFSNVDSEYKDWSAGARLSIPWGSGERADYDKAQLEKKQALLALKRLEQRIILDVRDKARDVDVQYRQVNASKVSKEKEKQNYTAQKKRYSAGQISTHDILDYQDKLAQSELDYIRALIDYNIAIINLDMAEGLTLAKNNIKLEG
jgi:outer membrane protein TolC